MYEYMYECGVLRGPGNSKPTIKIHKCPLCNSDQIHISKTYLNGGMHETYINWQFYCKNCGMINIELPADNYYGRKYFETVDDAAKRWNELCEKYGIKK